MAIKLLLVLVLPFFGLLTLLLSLLESRGLLVFGSTCLTLQLDVESSQLLQLVGFACIGGVKKTTFLGDSLVFAFVLAIVCHHIHQRCFQVSNVVPNLVRHFDFWHFWNLLHHETSSTTRSFFAISSRNSSRRSARRESGRIHTTNRFLFFFFFFLKKTHFFFSNEKSFPAWNRKDSCSVQQRNHIAPQTNRIAPMHFKFRTDFFFSFSFLFFYLGSKTRRRHLLRGLWRRRRTFSSRTDVFKRSVQNSRLHFFCLKPSEKSVTNKQTPNAFSPSKKKKERRKTLKTQKCFIVF